MVMILWEGGTDIGMEHGCDSMGGGPTDIGMEHGCDSMGVGQRYGMEHGCD